MKDLETPASVNRRPGLVRLLSDYPDMLPTPAASTSKTAVRLSIEVADFLDAQEQTDVQLSDITQQWLHDFIDYLDTFYASEVVTRYVEGVRFVKEHYSDEASDDPLRPTV